MVTDPKPLRNEELLHQVEETARAQNRQPEDLLNEAVSRYLDDQKWESLLTTEERQPKEKGLAEADVPRLIEDVRRENRTSER